MKPVGSTFYLALQLGLTAAYLFFTPRLSMPHRHKQLANTLNIEEITMTSSSGSDSSIESGSSDAQSESSSIVYGHEPFAQFQSKVLIFARSPFLPHLDVKDKITIERLRGGTYNRIIGLTFTKSQSETQDLTSTQPIEERACEPKSEYILRVPRFEAAQVDADVAALLFVKRLPAIDHGPDIPALRVPKVIAFDDTESNTLGDPFMVQERLHGQSLLDVYPQLGHDQQRRVAHDLGRAYRRMLAVSSTQAGRLVLPDDNKSLDAEIHVTPWDPCSSIFFKSERKPRPYHDGRASESVLELLERTFQEHKACIRERLPKDTLRPARLDRFRKMGSEMDAAGYFKQLDGHFALSHLDLEPRNILVDQDSPPGRPIISGILDWDSAVLAPVFMSCTPPMWIWSWQEDEDEDERMANEVPAATEQKVLKAEFEAAAGPLYIQCAYNPVYRLARRLVRFAIDGIRSTRDEQEAEAMLEEWEKLHQQDVVKPTTANVKM